MAEAICRRHEGLLDGWNGVRRQISLFWSMVGTFDNLLYVGYRVLLVLLGAVFARRGRMRISDLFVFLSMADTFMNFIWDFQAEAYQNTIAAARKLLELWSCPQERTNGAALQWQEDAPVEARDVRYAYDGQRMALDAVSYTHLDVYKRQVHVRDDVFHLVAIGKRAQAILNRLHGSRRQNIENAANQRVGDDVLEALAARVALEFVEGNGFEPGAIFSTRCTPL